MTGPHVPGPERAPDASMSLLTQLMRHPLDEGYALAAAARARGVRPPRRAVGAAQRAAVGILAVALGLLVATAATSLRDPESVLETRRVLAGEITSRTADADAREVANQALSAQIGRLQAEQLTGQDATVAAAAERFGVAAGAVAVSGPGVVVTLEDAADAVANPTDADPDAFVQDQDLQVVVNGLWAAGAEAVAVNGHRLTALTAIRSAGQAILVDVAPVTSPYRVEAIGDPQALQVRLARSPAGDRLSLLKNTYDIPTAVAGAAALSLPGAGPAELRYATPVPRPVAPGSVAPDVASSGAGPSSDTSDRGGAP